MTDEIRIEQTTLTLITTTKCNILYEVQASKLSLDPSPLGQFGREEVRDTAVQASGEITPDVMSRTSEIETDSRWPSGTGDSWNEWGKSPQRGMATCAEANSSRCNPRQF